jgi:membrane protease YdiL (CAAX protease family)
MRALAVRYPLLFSVIVVAVYDPGLTAALSGLTKQPTLRLSDLLNAQVILSLYVAALLTSLRWWREAGFLARLTRRSLLSYLPWLLLPLLTVADCGQVTSGPSRILGFALFALLVGLAEEGLLRGVVLRALLPGGVMRAALLSSLLFGVAHLSNMFQGREVGATIVQAIYATFIGIGFAGCRLYTGAIWPAIIMHGLIDFADFASRDFTPSVEAQPFTAARAIAPIVITGLYALYGWWLLRRHRGAAAPQG